MFCPPGKYAFFHPILNVGVMARATTTTLPPIEKGQENHIELGPHVNKVTPEVPAFGLVI